MRDQQFPPRRRIRSTCLIFAGTLCLTAVTGCYSSLAELDRDVAEMIERRQQLALGQEGVSDSAAGRPAYPGASPGLYEEKPATYNPSASELPARVAAPNASARSPYEVDPNAESIDLDLPALLAFSIENAPEYRAQKERLFLVTLSLIIERHAWGPRFFSTLSSDISGTPESGDFDTALDLIGDFTITQRLPYGGTASVAALVNYTNLLQQASTNTSADPVQDSSIRASINLPLLRGAGEVAREDLIQAERDLIYAAREFERFRREFFVDISNTYFSLLREQNRIENQLRQLEGLERLANEQRELLAAGRIPGFEADDAEAQVLFGQSDLASEQDGYASSLDSFKLRIGMPVSQPLTILRADIQVPRPALDAAGSIMIGQAARLDLQTTADQIDDARRSVRVARDQMRGDLDLDASINLNSDRDRDVDGLDLELDDSDYRVGLEYRLPLDRKIEQARYRSSLIDLEAAQRDYRTQRDRVALDIRDASRDIQRSTLTLELQGRNVALAERRLENIKILRRRGEVPPRRLIEAEQDLLDARNSRDQSQADLQTSVLNYLLQTGQMRVDAQGRWLAPGTLVVPQDAEHEAGELETPDPIE